MDNGYESASTSPKTNRRRVSVPSKIDILKSKRVKEGKMDETLEEKSKTSLQTEKKVSNEEGNADTTVIRRCLVSEQKPINELEISPRIKIQTVSSQKPVPAISKFDKEEEKQKDVSGDKTLNEPEVVEQMPNVTSTPTKASPRKRKLPTTEGGNSAKRTKKTTSASKPLNTDVDSSPN
ncbi:hypothetical protein HII13_002325 [Brettanomyces bruxellensis]|nr:hypothetical protein HII13_002325 [Brettanomyces bruxellensis]